MLSQFTDPIAQQKTPRYADLEYRDALKLQEVHFQSLP